MNRSPEEIEREIEATRAEVDRTAEALKDKMSPGQLMDEVMRSFKGSGGGEMMQNLGTRVKDNPLPLAMIGAGMAWLMMDSGKSSRSDGYAGVAPEPRSYDPYGGADVYATEIDVVAVDVDGSSPKDKVKDGLHSAKDKASSAAGSVKDKASSALHSTKDKASSAASNVSDKASSAARKAQTTFYDAVQSEPLIVGALGVALGAALGAALPSSRFEDDHLGPMRDRTLDKGKEKLDDVKAAAGSAIRGAKTEAERQGFGDDVGDLAEKARNVVRAGAENARRENETRTGR